MKDIDSEPTQFSSASELKAEDAKTAWGIFVNDLSQIKEISKVLNPSPLPEPNKRETEEEIIERLRRSMNPVNPLYCPERVTI